jgi:DUF2075 family protein
MTSFEFREFDFERNSVTNWALLDGKHKNWPVVYTINNAIELYVGETTSASTRMVQHLRNEERRRLVRASVLINDTFNTSACKDLEAQLIRYFSADDQFIVQNIQPGMTEADYYQRDYYQTVFDQVFERLRETGMLTRSIPELVNTDLFKYSPFKSLTAEQARVINEILERLFSDLELGTESTAVVQGDPGTGKTIVAIYLAKLLMDISRSTFDDVRDSDSIFIDFFTDGFKELISSKSVGLVVPQQSLRETLRKQFARIPGLSRKMVLTPFEVGSSGHNWDLLIVDEAHRLQQRSNQGSPAQNRLFSDINKKLYGHDSDSYTQLDWIKTKSKSQVFLLDTLQTIKPGDLSSEDVHAMVVHAKKQQMHFHLDSQLRLLVGGDYIQYVADVFSQSPELQSIEFGNYELKFFDNFRQMNSAIRAKDAEFGLARNIAGFGWKWKSKKKENKHLVDFQLDGIDLTWNRAEKDWINSPGSLDEVGSIHTVQGYDLNYAGVIVGPELAFDKESQKIKLVRENYFDVKGKQQNPGQALTDEDIFAYVANVYRVLMTRGIRGTYVYVVNPELREHLRQFFPKA